MLPDVGKEFFVIFPGLIDIGLRCACFLYGGLGIRRRGGGGWRWPVASYYMALV